MHPSSVRDKGPISTADKAETNGIVRLIAWRPDGWELEILFRQLLEPMPKLWEPRCHWQIEAYEHGSEMPPIGMCWVLDTSPLCPKDQEPYPAILEYIRVFQTHEQGAIASVLLEAARSRWPDICFEVVTSEEKTLVDSVEFQTSNHRWKLGTEED